MTRVVVADDQPVVLQGFAAILGSAPDLEVVGTAADGRALVELVARHPSTRVLVLTTFDLDEYVLDALRAGASGFLLKDVTAERLVEAVRLVADGSMLLGPNVTRRLVEDFSRRVRRPSPEFDALTPREREVALAAARGLSNGEIAAELYIGESTVKTHLSEVLRKLRCRDRVQLVVRVHEAGLVEG